MSIQLSEYTHAVKNWHLVTLCDLTRDEVGQLVKLRQWCINRTSSVYGQWIDAPGKVSPDFHIDERGYTSWGKDWQFYFRDLEVAIEFKLVYKSVFDAGTNKT